MELSRISAYTLYVTARDLGDLGETEFETAHFAHSDSIDTAPPHIREEAIKELLVLGSGGAGDGI